MRVPLVRVQRVALLAGAVAVAAVGCAGSSGHGPATGPNTRQARFVAGADGVCTELEARLVALPKPTPDQQRQLGTPTPDSATLRAAGDQLAANDLKAFEDALQRLRALGKPPGNPVAWQQFLDAFQAWIDAFKAQIAANRAKLSPQLAPLYDQAMHAVRQALALTLHDLFLIAIALSAIALVASLFMPDVPLRSRIAPRQATMGEVPASQPEAAVG